MIINAIAKNHWLLSTSEFSDEVSADWFDINFWRRNQAITGESRGRNVTYFCRYKDLKQKEHDWVLRHYYRGGLFGKLIHDQYRFTDIESTRVFQELMLLEEIGKLGLPGPRPVAGEIIKQGWAYRANIIIEKIPNAKDAFNLLKTTKLTPEQWQSIGICIKRFHNKQIFHSDLNIHNIMLDKKAQCYLIDFDKSEVRRQSDDWKKGNLDRLLRSLNKELHKNDSFFFEQKDWQILIDAYSNHS